MMTASFIFFSVPASAATGGGLPPPLLELTFGHGAENTGSLGGQARFEEYVPGEGPVYFPGRTGMGVRQVPRSWPGPDNRMPAGGAVVFEGPALNNLSKVTLTLWFRPEKPHRLARLLYYSNQWDVYLSRTRIGFNVRHNGRDHHRVTPADRPVVEAGRWNFLAVTHDRAAGRAVLYHATENSALRRVAEWTGIPLPDAGTGPVQIGNLEKIRPFRGGLDSIRIYGQLLSADQLRELNSTAESRAMTLNASAALQPRLPGLFAHGDVLLSSRSKRKNSMAAIEAFNPDRLMWCYSADPGFIRACRSAGVRTFQAAINSIAGVDEPEAQALDLDGKPVVAPWMVAFSPKKPWYWGCNNRPRFLEYSLERAKKAVAAGADWVQFDDWSMIVSAHSWSGAGFCDDCMAAFRDYLRRNVPPEKRRKLGTGPLETFDYRTYLHRQCGIADAAAYMKKRGSLATTPVFEDFQRRSVRRFFRELRQQLDRATGRTVPLSINASLFHPDQRTNYLVDVVDFLQGETWHMGLADLAVPAKTAEGLGKWQVFVPKPRDLRTARRAIAASYALGQLMLVPWDMYMGSDATGVRPRYYGKPEQYGDLFRFVHASRALLDGFETCATAALLIDLDGPRDMDRLHEACERLFQLHVPFSIAPAGSRYYRAALRREVLSRMRYVLVACDPEKLSAPDRQVLGEVAAGTPVLTDRETDDAVLESASPFEVWGPAGIILMPRAPRETTQNVLALHVLNRTERDSVAWVSVLIRKHALPGAVTKVVWHTPEAAPVTLPTEEHVDGTRIIFPRIGVWGIAEIHFR